MDMLRINFRHPRESIKFLSLFFAVLTLVPERSSGQWVKGTTPYNDYAFLSLAVMGNNLIAVCGGEVFRSTDLGTTWLDANNGIEFTSDAEFLFPYGRGVFVGTIYNAAILYSDDSGQNWQVRNKGFVSEGCTALSALGGDTILASAGPSGLYRTTDTGMNWNVIPWDSTMHIVYDTSARALTSSGGYVYAGCDVGGIFRSSDRGTSWQNVLLLPRDTPVYSMAALGSYIFAGVGSRGEVGYVYRSTDWGQTWHVANTGLPFNERPGTFFVLDSSIYVGFSGGGSVFRSADSGTTWINIADSNSSIKGNAFASGWGDLFVGGGYLYRRPLSDLSVVLQSNTLPADSIEISLQNSLLRISSHSLIHSITLFDILGRELHKEESTGLSLVMDLHGLPTGFYIVRIETDAGISVRKIVVN